MFSCPNLNENCARKSRPFVVVITNWNCEVYVLELEWMKMIWWKANEESSAWRSEHPYPQLPDPTFHFPLLTSYTYASDLRPPKFSDQMMKSTGEWQLKRCCYSRINSPRIAFYFDRRRAPIFFGISSKTMDIKLSIVFVSSFTLGQKIAAMDIQFAITITLVEALMYSLYSSTSFQNKRIHLWTRFVQKFIHPKFELPARDLSLWNSKA